MKLLAGREQSDAGSIRIGETVRMSYVDQNWQGIDPDTTVWQLIADGHDHFKIGGVEMPSRAYVAAFGFKGVDQPKSVRVLSGGELNRLTWR